MELSQDKTILISITKRDIIDGTVIIPNSVTYIAEEAFFYISELVRVHIPSNVSHIGPSAFEYCKFLEEVIFSDGLISIGKGAFSFCSKLKTIKMPSTLSEILESAFKSCYGLTNIDLNDELIFIGKKAFSQCYTLTKFKFPPNIERIENEILSCSYNIREIHIPKTTKKIGRKAFIDTRERVCDLKLEKIIIDCNHETEFKKVKSILPVYLRKKAIPRCINREWDCLKSKKIYELLNAPALSPLFHWENSNKRLPISVLQEISEYVGSDDSHWLINTAQRALNNIKAPITVKSLVSKKNNMSKIFKKELVIQGEEIENKCKKKRLNDLVDDNDQVFFPTKRKK